MGMPVSFKAVSALLALVVGMQACELARMDERARVQDRTVQDYWDAIRKLQSQLGPVDCDPGCRP